MKYASFQPPDMAAATEGDPPPPPPAAAAPPFAMRPEPISFPFTMMQHYQQRQQRQQPFELVASTCNTACTTPCSSSSLPSPRIHIDAILENINLLARYYPDEVIQACYHIDVLDMNNTVAKIPHIDELIQALRIAPQLVMEESPIHRYYTQLCGTPITNDPQIIEAAATKLAYYWKIRNEAFGVERAYLPMKMRAVTSSSPSKDGESGESNSFCQNSCCHNVALSEDDVRLFQKGFMVVLTATGDVKGRSIVATDSSGLDPKYDAPEYDDSKLRAAFYVGHLLSQNPATQTHGILSFAVATGRMSKRWNEWTTSAIRRALPIKEYEYHAMFMPSKMVSFSAFFFSLARYFIQILAAVGLGRSANLHFGTTDESVVNKVIQQAGVGPQDVPTWMGGQWSKDHFLQWQQEQIQREGNHVSIETKNENHQVWDSIVSHIPSLPFSTDSSLTVTVTSTSSQGDSLQDRYDDDRSLKPPAKERERKSKIAIKSQLKRDRERAKVQGMEHEVTRLMSANATIKEENKQLEMLLLRAQHQIKNAHDPEADPPPRSSEPEHTAVSSNITLVTSNEENHRNSAPSVSVSSPSQDGRTDEQRQEEKRRRFLEKDKQRARMKRMRAKAQLDDMQNQVNELEVLNTKARQDNELLAKLLRYAQEEVHLIEIANADGSKMVTNPIVDPDEVFGMTSSQEGIVESISWCPRPEDDMSDGSLLSDDLEIL